VVLGGLHQMAGCFFVMIDDRMCLHEHSF
jgi:hypothetical protein